jgi:hypothetical protein
MSMPKKPFFVSSIKPEFHAIIDEAYAMAKAEAMRIFSQRGIQTKIELLRPVHLGYSTTGATIFTLPGSANSDYTLKSNTALFPWGVINQDPTWFSLKWYEGAGTKYIGDWYTRPVYFFEEMQGAYGGQLEPYAFRGDQSFRFYALSNTGSTTIQGWLLAFAVMPTTLEEVKITV